MLCNLNWRRTPSTLLPTAENGSRLRESNLNLLIRELVVQRWQLLANADALVRKALLR